MRLILFFIIFSGVEILRSVSGLFIGTAYANGYQFLQYRVENGLNTDIIKTIAQDSLGFIWIGSDEGLTQFIGNQFISYPQATKSHFVKDLIKLHDGRLLVLDDLGLNEIINRVDTVEFKQILPGARVPTDTSIWYPKSIFEDSAGNLWIGEPQSIVKYDGKTIERMSFGPEDNSSSFIRSFSFTELPNGIIIISSFTGNFFVFDPITKKLSKLNTENFHDEVNDLYYWNDAVYIAGSAGLYRAEQIMNGSVKFQKILNDKNLSYLLPISDTELLVGAFSGATLIIDKEDNSSELPFKLTVVNQAFKSQDHNLWLSTEKGVVLLKPHIFVKIDTDSENIYVESVALNPNNDQVYFSSKEHIRVYDKASGKSQIFDFLPRGYFLSLQIFGNDLWASNGANIFKYNFDGEIVKSWDFSPYGRYIFDMLIDDAENVWFTQEASVGLKKIDASGKVFLYGEELGLDEEITIARLGPDGIYAGSNSEASYLYFKKSEDSVFQNISRKINFLYEGDLRIEDIAIDGNVIWMASSIGLLRQEGNAIELVWLEDKFTNLLVKSVKVQEGTPFIWITNAYGLIQFNKITGDYNIYDESHGLPSNTINTRAVYIGAEGVWLGTASGLAFSDYNFIQPEKTPVPYIFRFEADGRKYSISELDYTQIPPRPNIEITVTSPAYPGNKVKYQYRFDESGSSWKNIPDGNILTFSKLKSGNYKLLIRAKKSGNYDRSDPRMLEFVIEKTFFETFLFKVIIVLAVFSLIVITRHVTMFILKKRQLELQKIVAERTGELAKVNENLLVRNKELDQFVYSTSHDLIAPLKSIRGLINIAKYENDIIEQKSLLNRMNESVVKLERFIKDVISYSRNARLEIKQEPIKLKNLVIEILDHISNLEHFKLIKIEIDISDDLIIESDETRVKIILNNLISNAVKFQRIGDEENPLVRISYRYSEGRHELTVSDNGQGIAKEYQEKIFNMFYRANVSADGSGLGLYILKETVLKLNGEVKLKSEEGKGSIFTVSFP